MPIDPIRATAQGMRSATRVRRIMDSPEMDGEYKSDAQ
jgi:hypothetical protein